MLLTKIMKVVCEACMSKVGYDKAMDVLNELDGVLYMSIGARHWM
jgi:hypothetical protein